MKLRRFCGDGDDVCDPANKDHRNGANAGAAVGNDDGDDDAPEAVNGDVPKAAEVVCVLRTAYASFRPAAGKSFRLTVEKSFRLFRRVVCLPLSSLLHKYKINNSEKLYFKDTNILFSDFICHISAKISFFDLLVN